MIHALREKTSPNQVNDMLQEYETMMKISANKLKKLLPDFRRCLMVNKEKSQRILLATLAKEGSDKTLQNSGLI